MKNFLGALAAVFVVIMGSGAFADAIVQYTGAGSAARALFPANDLLDWGQLGPPFGGPGGTEAWAFDKESGQSALFDSYDLNNCH